MSAKIKSVKELGKLAGQFRSRGKKIAALSGAFDILHAGHVSFIARCKKQTDVLFLLLNSDRSVRSYKGRGRPINPQKTRAKVVSALQDVDFVCIFNEPDPRRVLDILKPDIFCQGDDWGLNCVERETVEKNSGRIRVFKKIKGFSTTRLINKIRRN